MARTGRRARKRRRNDILKIAIGILFIGGVIGGAIYAKLDEKAPADAKNLCPATGPTAHTIVLVDKSDPMSFTQRKDFDVLYEEIVRKRVPKGSLLSIYALGDDFKDTAEPLIELCNPGDGSDVDPNTGNPERVAKKFREKYLRPMLDLQPKLISDKPGKFSPIFEMMQLVGITGFRKHDVKGERHLIVISDMLHNTPQFSMYKRIPKYEEFGKSPYSAKATADLSGVEVELRILMHTPQLQKSDLAYFWEEYVNKAKGTVRKVYAING